MVYYRETGKKAKKLNGKSGKECAALGSTEKEAPLVPDGKDVSGRFQGP